MKSVLKVLLVCLLVFPLLLQPLNIVHANSEISDEAVKDIEFFEEIQAEKDLLGEEEEQVEESQVESGQEENEGFAQFQASNPLVEVTLRHYIGNTTSINVNVSGAYKDNKGALLEGTYQLKVENGKIVAYKGNTKFVDFPETLIPTPYSTNSYISINDRRYLGTMKFTLDGGNIRPVNTLPLEDYLKGVVPYEMPASWNEEALKAQAVAARTYVARRNFKVDDTQATQRYGGYYNNDVQMPNAYIDRIERSVNGSAGKVLKSGSSLISAVYSSSNGGHTESNSGAWGSDPLNYLPAKVDSYDPKHVWNVDLEKQQIDLSGKDLKKPEQWWASTTEKNSVISNSVKTWLKANDPNVNSSADVKIVSIPTVDVHSERTTGNRIRFATVEIEYMLKNGSTYVKNSNGEIQRFQKKYERIPGDGLGSLRSLLGTMNMRSTLVDVAESPIDVSLTRINGRDRLDTSVEISKEMYPTGFASNKQDKVVFITTAFEFADALSAAPLAAQYGNAPILLTRTDQLSNNVVNEIKRLKADTVYIIGGTSAVSTSIEKSLSSISGVTEVDRISGKNRYETNLKINERLQNVNGFFVASGENFADALASAPIAASRNWAIVLSRPDQLPNSATENYIKSMNKGGYLLGGTVALSNTVESKVKQLASNPVSRLSVSGGDRYDTLAVLLETFKSGFNMENILISTGNDFPDALASTSFAASKNAPLILLNSRKNSRIENFLSSIKDDLNKAHVLGGSVAVPDTHITNTLGTKHVLKGRGFGHGVGMSQWGAQSMANTPHNKKFNEILNFYYPDTSLTDL